MTDEKYAGTVTLIVKGVKIVDTATGKLPAGTICVKAVQLPGLEGLPAGTAAVQAVALTDPASKRFCEYAVEQLPLRPDGTLPAGAVVVEAMSLPELKPVFVDGMTVEVLDVTAIPAGPGQFEKFGIRVPTLPPRIGGKDRKLGIRIPVVPPKIKPKKK